MRNLTILTVALAVLALLPGCATKKYTRSEVSGSEARIGERLDGVETMIEENQGSIQDQSRRLEEQDAQLGELSKTTREALERAIAAGKLAEGKIVYERTLSDEQVLFAVNGTTLSDSAMAELDAFADELAARNKAVYIEIQGHTDSAGSEAHNLDLGYQRAESVRRYLNQRHGFPLHLTSVISYGEAEPIADNSTREGRAKNRRVGLIVLE